MPSSAWSVLTILLILERCVLLLVNVMTLTLCTFTVVLKSFRKVR